MHCGNRTVRVAACQVPDLREDLDGALSWIEDYAAEAASQNVSLLCFPECFLQGYETKDRQRARRHALDLNSDNFARLLARLAYARPMLVIGLIEIAEQKLFNTAVVVNKGRLVGRYRKTHLFDGESVFEEGTSFPVFTVESLTFGINICNDTNFPEAAAAVARQQAQLIVCPANNMLRRANAEKWKHRHNEIRALRAKETGLWLVSADVYGERDGRISYGPSSVINPQGVVIAQVPLEQPGMVIADIEV